MNNLIYYIFAACSLLLLSNELTAQEPITFERYYSDSGAVEGRRVRQTFDGGYIVAGRRNAFATFFSNDAILMKTDSMGDVEWLKVYGTRTGDDWFNDVQQTADSGYIACGFIPQSGMQDNIYVVKTDKNGDTLWTRAWGSSRYDIARSVQETYDGGYIVAGQWDTTGILLRLNSLGDTIWAKLFYDGYVSFYSVSETADSGFVATGVLNANHLGLNLEVYVVRVDKNGNTLWEKNYGYVDADYGFSVKTLPDGSFLVGGYSFQGFTDYDSYLLKLNEYGDTIWTKTYSDPRENGIVEIAINQDGSLAFAEAKSVIGMSYQFSILKTDTFGNFLWRTEFGGGGADYIYGISRCADGGFVVCGMLGINTSDYLYLIKTNTEGIVSHINNIEDIKNSINIYPNPFKNNLNIDLKDFPSENCTLEIFNYSGVSVYRNSILGGANIKINALGYLPTGTYFLSIKNNYENYIIPIVHN